MDRPAVPYLLHQADRMLTLPVISPAERQGPSPAIASTAHAATKPELLAPAGDMDCVCAAIENGADAVYFGLQEHNARARAANFKIDELDDLIRLLHRRGVKGYVALNTLVFPQELDGLEPLLRRIAQ